MPEGLDYTKVNWENAPSKKTPINDKNLGTMDDGIAKTVEKIKEILSQLEGISSDITKIKKDVADIQTAIADVPHWEDVS